VKEEKLNKETNNDNQWYSSWVESIVPIWELGEEGRVIPKLDAFGQQRQEKGCLMQKDILIEDKTKVKFWEFQAKRQLYQHREWRRYRQGWYRRLQQILR